MNKLLKITAGVIVLLLGFTFARLSAEAAINQQIPFQGKLTDENGVTVTDGNYDMLFKLYTVPTEGSPIWTGTHTTANGNPVGVDSGIFAIMIGSGTGNSLASVNLNQTLYLGVTVGTDAEMTPRQELGAVAQSFISKYLETASGSGAAAGTSAGNVLLLDGSGNISISGSTSTSTLALTSGYLTLTGLSSAPTDNAGRIYYNSTNGNLYVYDGIGSSWVDLTSGGYSTIDSDYGDETVSSVWTITGDWINTANPWADNEIQDDLTVTSTKQIKATLTTAQLSLNYDTSNYFITTVGSAGGVTLNALGTSPAFTFADAVTIQGNLNLSTGSVYQINGSQIGTTNLSDSSNIGMLNENETVSGAWVFSAEPSLSGSGRHTRKVTLSPEYANGVLTAAGRSGTPSAQNTGVFTSDDYTDGSYNSYNYYQFESAETDVLQDYYIKVIWTLPQDFSAWATSNAVTISYRTEDASSSNNDVEAYLYLSGCNYVNSTDCATAGSNPSDTSNASTSWATITIDDTSLDLADTAGEQLVIYIRLESFTSYYAQVSDINISYLSKW